MKRLFSLLAVALLFAACTKNTKETVIDPAPEGAFTRTIVYPNQNNSSFTASYSGNALVDASARLEGNLIYLGLVAMPKTNGTTGDGVWFTLNKAFLQQGLVGSYNLDAQTAPAATSVRYNHMWQKEAGGFWASIHETSMGLKMEGTLHITQYNADRQLVSGYFNLVIKDLISDPMRYDGPSTIDPLKQNNITLTGTFNHIKLVTE